jgi:hypothetical protein
MCYTGHFHLDDLGAAGLQHFCNATAVPSPVMKRSLARILVPVIGIFLAVIAVQNAAFANPPKSHPVVPAPFAPATSPARAKAAVGVLNVTWPNGRHELFVVGTDANHGVWHSWQASASVCGGQLLDAVKATGAAYADTASPGLWATLDTQSPSTGRHSCAL